MLTSTADALASVSAKSSAVRFWLAALGLLCFFVWTGHSLVYSQFQRYDDEGYLLLTVKQFLQGYPLYDEVYTQYGPAYYLWEQFLHGLLSVPLTHDATRSVTLVIWIVCSILVASPIWLITRRPGMTAIGAILAFLHMTELTYEPGHPQELCLIGVMGSLSIVLWRLVAHRALGQWPATAIGVLVAVTLLTKVNIGVFLAGAMTLGLVIGLRPSLWRGVLVKIIVVGAFAGVAGVMFRDLARPDIASWVAVVWIGLAAALLAGSNQRESEEYFTAKELIACAAGFALTSAAIVAAIVQEGTSLRALFAGLFIWPLRFPAVFWQGLPVPLAAVALGPVWLAIAECRRRHVTAIQRWMPFIALLVGPLVLLLSVSKAYDVLFAFGPPLVWMATVGSSLSAGEQAARRILVFVTIFFSLQTYPMPAGTQITLGTALYVPFALIVIADAEREILKSRTVWRRAPPVVRHAIVAAFVVLVTTLGGRVQADYTGSVSLHMPGATAVRAPAKEGARYWWLTTNLRAHCDGFLSAPGINSLYLWTGLSPVSNLNTTLWSQLFDDDQQRRVLASAEPIERFCAVWEPRIMSILMSLQSGPLAVWLDRNFEPVANFDRWEFRVRRGTTHPMLYQGEWLDEDGVRLALPPLGRNRISRIAVVDGYSNRTIADTASSDGLVLADEHGAGIDMAGGIDVSTARAFVIRAVARPSSHEPVMVLRLWTATGESLATVPVVDVKLPAAEPGS
jgi:hypothetical protein